MSIETNTAMMKYFWKKKTILSFFAAVLIVAIHNSTTSQFNFPDSAISEATKALHNFLAYALGGIAVPFFFFMSGAALFRNYNPDKFRDKMRSRLGKLVVPFLVWNTIGLLVALAYTYTPLRQFVSGREFFEPSVKNLFEGIFLYKYNFHFWFMFDLIIYTLLTPVIYGLIKRKTSGMLFLVGLFVLPLLVKTPPVIKLEFTVFYGLGCYIGKHHLRRIATRSPRRASIICGLMSLVLLAIRMLAVSGFIHLTVIGSQLSLLALLSCLYFAVDLWLPKAADRRCYDQFFPIYVLHPYVVALFVKIFKTIGPNSPAIMLASELLATLFAVIVITKLADIWQKRLPKLYAFAFGGALRSKT